MPLNMKLTTLEKVLNILSEKVGVYHYSPQGASCYTSLRKFYFLIRRKEFNGNDLINLKQFLQENLSYLKEVYFDEEFWEHYDQEGGV